MDDFPKLWPYKCVLYIHSHARGSKNEVETRMGHVLDRRCVPNNEHM